MKTKIVALKKNEDFKRLLKGRKLSNKYFVMFYKKLLRKNYNNFNIFHSLHNSILYTINTKNFNNTNITDI